MVGNIVTQPFSAIAAELSDHGDIEIEHLPFGQISQVLSQPSSSDFLLIHLDHRRFFDIAPDAEALTRADELAGQVRVWLGRNAASVILNTVPFIPRSPVEADLHDQIERLAAVNRVLFDLAREHERVSVIDAAGALADIGYRNAIRERNRHLMQAPYSPQATAALARRYALSIRSALVPRRKVVVVDADNTLWGGVVGEAGVDGIAIDREYPGIVHYLLQEQLKRLRGLGILIAAVTKNNEPDFLEVFERRKMPLKLGDFVAYRSNWETKSDNILAIAQQLNLGVDAFLFIDDNPFEIEEVRARLPEVECHLFAPGKPEEALVLLDEIASLSARSLTLEDLQRSDQYGVDAQRRALQEGAKSLSEYLASLKIEITANCNNRAHVRRIAQLTNKTNQFNLTCRRYSEAEIEAAMVEGSVYDFRLSDRFGDLGIIAVAIVEKGSLVNFLMSCRALGRKVETAILRYVSDRHPGLGAEFRADRKNAMVERFFDENGFVPIFDKDGTKRYEILEGPVDVQQYRIVAE